MAGYAHTKIEEVDAIRGVLEGLTFDGEEHPLDADHVARVGPGHSRKVLPGPDGLRVLVIGARPS